MSHTIQWYQQGRIIKSAFQGVLTIDEMKQVSDEAIVLLGQGQAPVHIITDLHEMKQFPTNIMQAKDTLAYFSHPSMGWHVFYGAPTLATSLISVFGKVTNAHARAFRTEEQALKFLMEQDATLKAQVPSQPE